MHHSFVRLFMAAAIILISGCAATPRSALDPAAVRYIPPDQIQWKDNTAGTAANAPLGGDPAKPGFESWHWEYVLGNVWSPPTETVIA